MDCVKAKDRMGSGTEFTAVLSGAGLNDILWDIDGSLVLVP